MARPDGGCDWCGGYCSLDLCSPACSAAYWASKGRPDACHECGTTEDIDPVFITCRKCLKARYSAEELAEHARTHDARGRYIATSDYYK